MKKAEEKLQKIVSTLKATRKEYHYCIRIFVFISVVVVVFVVINFRADIKDLVSQWIDKIDWVDWQKPTFTEIGGAIIAIVSIALLLRRTINQNKQIKIQIQQRVDDRFTTAVNLLGSKESSARTGAIYSLHALALEDEKYRNEIAEILCSHIRSKTVEQGYRDQPSNEIRTAINLLFREKNSLYKRFSGLPTIDLSFSYLRGAYFRNAKLQGATFYKAECQGADFRGAQCQEVRFHETRCQGADFYKAQCQKAQFHQAQCQEAHFDVAECQEADFCMAECQGANFYNAKCQFADFSYAKCQEAKFVLAECQGANFKSSECRCTRFNKAKCQGANFLLAKCQGAFFNFAKCQGANFVAAHFQRADFYNAKCQGAIFYEAHCQGIRFNKTQCQGANFVNTQCQGASFDSTQFQGLCANLLDDNLYTLHLFNISNNPTASPKHYLPILIQLLKGRIEKDTELNNIVFAGEVSEVAINVIEKAHKHLQDEEWYAKMKKIIEDNQDKPHSNELPAGIETGILEDSLELQDIIKELEEIEKERRKQSDSDDSPISK